MYSPSISSSSSALSSPQLGCAAGAEVPSLVPSALGSALRSFTERNSYYVSSSSSASSTSWSVLTDEEDQELPNPFTTDYNYHDAFEDVDPNMKVQNFINSVNNFALSYTRRPSGTNNHSTVPQGKVPSSRLVRGLSGSAPMHSRVIPDDLSSEIGLSSNDTLESDYEAAAYLDHSTTAKIKRTRNRASLPACFSLLQMGSPAKPLRSSPISASSGYTLRQSPPTPKIAHKNPASNMQSTSTVVPLSGLHDTPRGRRREAGQSSCSRRSGHSSPSRSRSRRSRVQATDTSDIICQATNIRDSCEPVFDRFAGRGRRTIRRNSSPSSRMTRDVEPAFNAGISQMGVAARHSGSGSRPHARGRMRVEELDGIGSTNIAPGYGTGRSGLVSRERGQQRRVPL
jgi:hypothetical protein